MGLDAMSDLEAISEATPGPPNALVIDSFQSSVFFGDGRGCFDSVTGTVLATRVLGPGQARLFGSSGYSFSRLQHCGQSVCLCSVMSLLRRMGPCARFGGGGCHPSLILSLEKPRASCCSSLLHIELAWGWPRSGELDEPWPGLPASHSPGLRCQVTFLAPGPPAPFLLGCSEHHAGMMV